jgi:hypothetical protein
MARRVVLKSAGRDVGERLLSSKLQILSGTGTRRPSMALNILTGRVAEQLSILESFFPNDPVVAEDTQPAPAPIVHLVKPPRPHSLARTVYLTDAHLRDIETIIGAWQGLQDSPRRLTRSAVLRRAVEHLRSSVEADPATFLLESQSPCPRS